MDTAEEEIDEGAFFWVGADHDDRAVPKPPAFPLAASSYPFSLSSSSSSPSSMPAPSSHNSSRSTREEVLPPYRRPTAGTSSAAAAEPLYPRIGFSSLSLAAGPGATPQPSAAGTATQRTPAHAPLQGCSFRLNPRLVALATPSPPADSLRGLLNKMKELEGRVKQRPTYDPCFEVEIVAEAKLDRQKQEHVASAREERYRQQRELVEAEAKRRQDIAITEWVEQQQQQPQRQQEGEDQAASTFPGAAHASSTPTTDEQALLDLSFPSPRLAARTGRPAQTAEPPPPYPGSVPQSAASPSKAGLIHFPAPSSGYTNGQLTPAASASASLVQFPGPPQHPSAAPTFHPPYHPAFTTTTAATPARHPYAPSGLPGRSVHTPYSVPSAATVQSPALPLPTGVMPRPSAFLPSVATPPSIPTATVNHTTPSARFAAPPRMTMEDYQRKYPVLASPERRAIFIQLLEMRFKPEIVALGLEIYSDNQVDKIVTFVANFHKLVEMGFSPERIKQALLLHEDGDVQKAIIYLEELDKLITAGLKESEIFDAFMLFDNDIQKASSFLTAHAALAQLGFGDLRIREALLMCENNQEKAVQYLMMNT
ncbi:UBA/TSN domain containing protein [Acanthamoeba castellanii str. Neff]|uniref:UBA/TSN domain containing protein n=1 Tax=Acanthamoeba castellanii (strain ATCC 30010 / Neff) TaxID=1257118 RepID=L8GWL7_ACACF|nr:UBA/TSN domain containing protein [Acanthamoeba castellanii str. Neff]ELR16491.1 UBA/TSN domain containing protein [Acanthamoeba castellanii str. Neff]